jgi:hypothetical protein
MFPLLGFTRAKANQMTRKSRVQVRHVLLFHPCEGQFYQHERHSLTIEAHQIKHSPAKQVETSHSQKKPTNSTQTSKSEREKHREEASQTKQNTAKTRIN